MAERITSGACHFSDTGTEVILAADFFGCRLIGSHTSFSINAHGESHNHANHADGIGVDSFTCLGDLDYEALDEIARVSLFGLLDSSLKLGVRGVQGDGNLPKEATDDETSTD